MLIQPSDLYHSAKIRVVGVGGGGSNAISSMIKDRHIEGVEFIAVNTDAQALGVSSAPVKVQIGDELTRGLGSGGNPEIGRKAAEESADKLHEVLQGSDMVFLTAGLGGGTGTGAMPFVAGIAKGIGALTIGVVTKPFSFEGSRRQMQAEEGWANLKDRVDALITIPNQRILEITDRSISILDAFKLADSVLGEAVQGISDMITSPGLINVDFADVKTIMNEAGSAMMGMGVSSGEDRSATAARNAIHSPLLELSIEGATGILFNIVAGRDFGMHEIDQAAQIISDAAYPDANIIFGTSIDESLEDQVKITVIATGFELKPNSISDSSFKAVPTGSIEPAGDKEEKSPEEVYDVPAFLRKS